MCFKHCCRKGLILKNSYLFPTSFLQARLLLSQRWDCNIPEWGGASRDLVSWLPSSGSYTWSSSTSHFPPAPPHWWKHAGSCPGWWAQLVLADSAPHSRAHLQPAGGGDRRNGRRGGWEGGGLKWSPAMHHPHLLYMRKKIQPKLESEQIGHLYIYSQI